MRRLSVIGVGIVSVGVLAVALLSPVGAHITTLPHLINHLEDEFLTEGPIVLNQNGPWAVLFGSADVEQGDLYRFDPTAGTSFEAGMLITGPRKIGGQRYALKSVKLCYGVSDDLGGDKIDTTLLTDVSSGSVIFIATDTTDRTADGCYTVAPPSPVKMDGSLGLRVEFDYSSAATDFLDVDTAFSTWVPA